MREQAFFVVGVPIFILGNGSISVDKGRNFTPDEINTIGKIEWKIYHACSGNEPIWIVYAMMGRLAATLAICFDLTAEQIEDFFDQLKYKVKELQLKKRIKHNGG